jgi:predicted TIM-barrel fold metal-dependent hydrolase
LPAGTIHKEAKIVDPIIIDTHVHLFQSREEGLKVKEDYEIWEYGAKADVCFSSYGGDPEEALKAINDAGAYKAVIVNLFPSPDFRDRYIKELSGDLDEIQKQEALVNIEKRLGKDLKASNVWVCTVAEKISHFVPFINIDPFLLDQKEAKNHIHDLVDNYGARGIKLHTSMQGFYLHNEKMVPILQTCMELDLPIVAHSGADIGVEQFSEPKAFKETLKVFPELRLILAHMGGGSWRQASELAEAFPQLCFDCSEIIEWTSSDIGPTDHELAQLILDVGHERVLMGSDFPWYDTDHNVERVMDLPLLAPEQKEEILGANAERILKLD